MYTVDCEDSNCVKCGQASKGQSSEEENQNEILMAEELVSKDLLLASKEKAFCFDSCRKLKDQIHYQITNLVGVLRQRERNLCAQVDQECCDQMAKIDRDATHQCIDKLLKRNSEPEKAPCRSLLVFTCEYHLISSELQKFGHLSYEDPAEEFQTIKQEFSKLQMRPAGDPALSTSPLVNPFEAPSMDVTENEKFRSKNSKDEGQYFEEDTDSVSSKGFGKNGSSDEDDIEIISRGEAAAVPSELPGPPRKSRFRFGRKRSCFPSLYSKKPFFLRENSSASKRPVCSKTKSKECVTAFVHPGMCDVEELPSFNERASQESSHKCLENSESYIILKALRREIASFNRPFSQESSSKCLANSDSSVVLEALRREIPSFNESSSQESSSECLGDSNAEGQGRDPSVALRSSFTKYLEKDGDSEWLVPEKSSEQPPSSGNSCIFNRRAPFFVANLDQWLSTKTKQKVVSDWLYSA